MRLSYFDSTCVKARTAVCPSRRAPIGTKLWETTFQVIPHISFFGELKKLKFQKAVYPLNMAPIGTKICPNMFQMIPHISFFDSKNVLSNFCLPPNIGIITQIICFGWAVIFGALLADSSFQKIHFNLTSEYVTCLVFSVQLKVTLVYDVCLSSG